MTKSRQLYWFGNGIPPATVPQIVELFCGEYRPCYSENDYLIVACQTKLPIGRVIGFFIRDIIADEAQNKR